MGEQEQGDLGVAVSSGGRSAGPADPSRSSASRPEAVEEDALRTAYDRGFENGFVSAQPEPPDDEAAILRQIDTIAMTESFMQFIEDVPSRPMALQHRGGLTMEKVSEELTVGEVAMQVREVLRCAWTLCDGTEHRRRPHVQPEDWKALSASVEALESLVRRVAPAADAGHAGTILINALPCVHGIIPARNCQMGLTRGCPGTSAIRALGREGW